MEAFPIDDDESSVDSQECGLSDPVAPAECCGTQHIYMVAFLSSHVGDIRALDSLRAVWTSTLTQDDPPNRTMLSVSCNPGLIAHLESFRQEALWQAAGIGASATVSFHEASNEEHMVHFRSLAVELEELLRSNGLLQQYALDRCWVVLGDDDGLWHPGRVCSYRKAALRSPGARALLAPLRCRVDSIHPSESKLDGVGKVESLLGAGQAVLEGADRMLEYFDYAVRLDVLGDFFGRIPEPLLSKRLGDMALMIFLESIGPDRKAVVPTGSCWMYFYSEHPQLSPVIGSVQEIQGSRNVDEPSKLHCGLVAPGDWARAEQEFPELARLQPDLKIEDLALAAAHCREWMEGLCVNMWVGGPYTSTQLRLLSRDALKHTRPPVPRSHGQEALSDWSLREVKEGLLHTCTRLGLLQDL